MTFLEVRIWEDDEFPVYGARLMEGPGYLPAGSIELRYLGREGVAAHVICGNAADDFMERLRATPDPEAQEHIMIHEIRKARQP